MILNLIIFISSLIIGFFLWKKNKVEIPGNLFTTEEVLEVIERFKKNQRKEEDKSEKYDFLKSELKCLIEKL